MRIRDVEVWGRRVSYRVTGSSRASPVVCLHGAGFDHSGLTWLGAARSLEGGRRVLVPDIPGYGGSDALPGPTDLPRLGAWAAAFAEAIGLRRADFAGLSMGGGMALWLGIHRPELVHRLIAVCPYGVMARAPCHPLVFAAVRAGILPAAYRAATLSGSLAGFGLGLSYADPSRVTERTVVQLRAAAEEQARRRSFDAFLSTEMSATSFRTDLRSDLGRISAPALLIAGRDDRFVPHARVRAACDLIAKGHYLVLPTGHWPMCERPDLFDGAVGRFLSE